MPKTIAETIRKLESEKADLVREQEELTDQLVDLRKNQGQRVLDIVMPRDAVGVTREEAVAQVVGEIRDTEARLEVIASTISTVDEALKASRREQDLKLAQASRAEWSKLTARAQEISSKTQKLLQEIREHEGTDGLIMINYREPKCSSTVLLLQAQHCLKRAEALERGAGDIGEWVDDVPIAGSAADAWSPPWVQPTVAPEPPKPFLPGKKGWRTELPRG